MDVESVLSALQNLKKGKVIAAEVAKAINMSPQNFNRKKRDKSLLSEKQIALIEKRFDVWLPSSDKYSEAEKENMKLQGRQAWAAENCDKLIDKANNCIKIPYYDVHGSCGTGLTVCPEPAVRSVMLGNDLICQVLRCSPENLHIIDARGDSMEEDGIYEGDVLLVDSSRIDPIITGIFVFTTQNNELAFVKRLYLRPDGILDIISGNKKYPKIEYTKKDLEKLDFRVKGRVIKNLSRGL